MGNFKWLVILTWQYWLLTFITRCGYCRPIKEYDAWFVELEWCARSLLQPSWKLKISVYWLLILSVIACGGSYDIVHCVKWMSLSENVVCIRPMLQWHNDIYTVYVPSVLCAQLTGQQMLSFLLNCNNRFMAIVLVSLFGQNPYGRRNEWFCLSSFTAQL